MPNRDEQHHRSARDVPEVGRPRGAIWRSLQADGVVWEGQVLLVGGEVDLAARLIVTHRRVVFVRGGDVVLEIPRGWLRQEPVLRRDGVLELFVATPESNPFDEPMRVPLRMRDGNAAAGQIIAMLAPGGVRRIAPDALSAIERAREAAPTPSFGGFWEGVDPVPSLQRDTFDNGSRGFGDLEERDLGSLAALDDLAPIEPPDRLIRLPSQPQPQRPLNGAGYGIAGLAPRGERRSPWGLLLRLCALTVLLATAAALGAGRLNLHLPGSTPGTGAVLIAPTPTTTADPGATTSEPAAEPTSDAPGTALSPEELTAVAAGVGGPNEGGELALEAASEMPLIQGAATPAAATPPAIAPTKPAIPTPVPTSSPPAAPPATPESTVAPATATPDTSAATPAQVAAAQPPAVNANEPPAQEIVVDAVRVAIPTALRDESLPKYGLPPGSGEWVLLIAELTNEGDALASLPMSGFRLFDRETGLTADLDSGVGVIARLAGILPERGPGDVIALEPGASTRMLLLYLLPPGSGDDLALLVGQSSLDLAPSLAAGSAEPATRPQLMQATVTEVLDGGRIAVDIDGLLREVSYLGFAAPAVGACFAEEAKAANARLVAGKPVWLEREATDLAADDALLRDVWVTDADGHKVLVAARLLEVGAGTTNTAAPDTRYQAWLSASSALGRTNGAGLWGACQEAGA